MIISPINSLVLKRKGQEKFEKTMGKGKAFIQGSSPSKYDINLNPGLDKYLASRKKTITSRNLLVSSNNKESKALPKN